LAFHLVAIHSFTAENEQKNKTLILGVQGHRSWHR